MAAPREANSPIKVQDTGHRGYDPLGQRYIPGHVSSTLAERLAGSCFREISKSEWALVEWNRGIQDTLYKRLGEHLTGQVMTKEKRDEVVDAVETTLMDKYLETKGQDPSQLSEPIRRRLEGDFRQAKNEVKSALKVGQRIDYNTLNTGLERAVLYARGAYTAEVFQDFEHDFKFTLGTETVTVAKEAVAREVARMAHVYANGNTQIKRGQYSDPILADELEGIGSLEEMSEILDSINGARQEMYGRLTRTWMATKPQAGEKIEVAPSRIWIPGGGLVISSDTPEGRAILSEPDKWLGKPLRGH